MKKIYLICVFLFIFLFPFKLFADSTKIYNEEYVNPLTVLESFLWNNKRGSNIGITSKININNRNLNATTHPASLNPNNIRIILSKLRYFSEEEEIMNSIFTVKDIEILSKNVSKGLLIANSNQDIIFQFINKKKKNNNKTKGIFFVQNESLNLVLFQINDCELQLDSNKKKFRKKKKEFHKNHPNFSFIKKEKKCETRVHNKISVTSKKGIYKRKTNNKFSWIIFTPSSWETNSIN